MEFHKEIEELKDLEEYYLKLCGVQRNSDKAIKAFHAWYKAMLVFFNRIIPSDNEDFKFIKSQDVLGNGHNLSTLYHRISGRYAMLLDDIECGKYSIHSLSIDNKTLTPMVFISHSSKDKSFAEALVSLLESLGMDSNNVFCSSVNGYGIKLSADIFTTLRNLFNEHALYVFFIHSPRYYNSTVSLNEMGAAWVLKTHFCSFLTPDMNLSDLKGVINDSYLSIKVDSEDAPARLTELKNDLMTIFGLAPIDEVKWERKRNQFLQSVREAQYCSDSLKGDTYSVSIKKADIGGRSSSPITPPLPLNGIDNQKSTEMKRTRMYFPHIDEIIGMMESNTSFSISELSIKSGLSIRTVRLYITKLIRDGVIIQIGTQKTTRYKKI